MHKKRAGSSRRLLWGCGALLGCAEQGGTGLSFDWAVAAALGRADPAGIPLLVAGGLGPGGGGGGGVTTAVEECGPALLGVDASSGLEAEPTRRPGAKDLALVRGYVEAALGAARQRQP